MYRSIYEELNLYIVGLNMVLKEKFTQQEFFF